MDSRGSLVTSSLSTYRDAKNVSWLWSKWSSNDPNELDQSVIVSDRVRVNWMALTGAKLPIGLSSSS